jgi:hypothetical protein
VSGAFYLLVKAPIEDDVEFARRLREDNELADMIDRCSRRR